MDLLGPPVAVRNAVTPSGMLLLPRWGSRFALVELPVLLATAGVSRTAAAASGGSGTPRVTVIPTGAGGSADTPLFPATGLEDEDKDEGFDLGNSVRKFSSPFAPLTIMTGLCQW